MFYSFQLFFLLDQGVAHALPWDVCIDGSVHFKDRIHASTGSQKTIFRCYQFSNAPIFVLLVLCGTENVTARGPKFNLHISWWMDHYVEGHFASHGVTILIAEACLSIWLSKNNLLSGLNYIAFWFSDQSYCLKRTSTAPGNIDWELNRTLATSRHSCVTWLAPRNLCQYSLTTI